MRPPPEQKHKKELSDGIIKFKFTSFQAIDCLNNASQNEAALAKSTLVGVKAGPGEGVHQDGRTWSELDAADPDPTSGRCFALLAEARR